MKFIVDEQLSYKLAKWLRDIGHDAIHADDIPHTAGKLSDVAICKFADKNNRVVITKDEDFWQRYLIIQEPKKLIYVTTGNIKNTDLIFLFDRNIHLLLAQITTHDVVEINQHGIIIRF